MINCPSCLIPVDGVTCPRCGYTDSPDDAPRERPDHHRCYFHDSQGFRCSNPGSLTQSIAHHKAADVPWFCADHFPPFRAMPHRGQTRLLPGVNPRDHFQRLRDILKHSPPPREPGSDDV